MKGVSVSTRVSGIVHPFGRVVEGSSVAGRVPGSHSVFGTSLINREVWGIGYISHGVRLLVEGKLESDQQIANYLLEGGLARTGREKRCRKIFELFGEKKDAKESLTEQELALLRKVSNFLGDMNCFEISKISLWGDTRQRIGDQRLTGADYAYVGDGSNRGPDGYVFPRGTRGVEISPQDVCLWMGGRRYKFNFEWFTEVVGQQGFWAEVFNVLKAGNTGLEFIRDKESSDLIELVEGMDISSLWDLATLVALMPCVIGLKEAAKKRFKQADEKELLRFADMNMENCQHWGLRLWAECVRERYSARYLLTYDILKKPQKQCLIAAWDWREYGEKVPMLRFYGDGFYSRLGLYLYGEEVSDPREVTMRQQSLDYFVDDSSDKEFLIFLKYFKGIELEKSEVVPEVYLRMQKRLEEMEIGEEKLVELIEYLRRGRDKGVEWVSFSGHFFKEGLPSILSILREKWLKLVSQKP